MYNAIATEPFFVLRLVVSLRLAYDAQGRITSQRRGSGRGGDSETGGEYSYYAKTNKLEKVANGMGGESANNRNMSASGNFVYDSVGNLIEDKSKDLKISYDWRGMPVEFVRQDENCKTSVCDSTKLVLRYDGSGRRVSKTRLMKSAADSDWLVYHITHYTGIGTEVRENYNGGSTAETKVVMNLPEGLGRYMPDDAEKMGGTQIPVGEHGKYYFGARYFDPFFALWMNPDPAGQFSNPYTYGGDPVNFVDPNGEEVATAVIVTGAIVGAIVGGSAAAYQCSNYGGGSCTEGVSTGAIIGAAAGAAGGVAGGAAAGAAAGAGEAAIVGGLAGGAAGSATSYILNGLLNDVDMSFGEGFRTAMIGAFSGAISGGVGYGWSQIPYLSYWEMGGRAVSSSVSSMAETLFTEEDFSHIGQAALEGLIYGAGSAEANTLVSLGLIYGINAFGGASALNKFYGTEHGEFMTEAQAATEMTNTPGSVSASVANDLSSLAIAVISGNGPFSHVRASDDYGKIVENNGKGVFSLGEGGKGGYKIAEERLTYVTKDYIGGQKNGATVASLKKMYGQNGWSSYKGAGLCVGASGMVNPYYTPRSPNGLYPWGLRNTYLYY